MEKGGVEEENACDIADTVDVMSGGDDVVPAVLGAERPTQWEGRVNS